MKATPTFRPDHWSVVKFLCEEVFPQFELPDTISSDNGKHCVAESIKVGLGLGLDARDKAEVWVCASSLVTWSC